MEVYIDCKQNDLDRGYLPNRIPSWIRLSPPRRLGTGLNHIKDIQRCFNGRCERSPASLSGTFGRGRETFDKKNEEGKTKREPVNSKRRG